MKNKNKIALIIFLFINLVMLVVALYLLTNLLITGDDPTKRLSSHIATTILSLLPFLYVLIKRQDTNLFIVIFYTIYIFLAVFLGSSLNFYNNYENINYDKLIHVLFGYASAILAYIIILKLKQENLSSLIFQLLFIFSFTLMIAAIWELFEYTSDQLFGTVTQGRPIYDIFGNKATDVGETMFDILANLIGGIIFTTTFYINKKGVKTPLMNLILNALE